MVPGLMYMYSCILRTHFDTLSIVRNHNYCEVVKTILTVSHVRLCSVIIV